MGGKSIHTEPASSKSGRIGSLPGAAVQSCSVAAAEQDQEGFLSANFAGFLTKSGLHSSQQKA